MSPSTSAQWLRTGDPPFVEVPKRSEAFHDGGGKPSGRMPVAGELNSFEEAIRQKENWALKIVENPSLVDKWTKEAGLPDHSLVEEMLQRLRTEARRIYVHDHAVHITSKQLPERAIDHNVIKADVKKADHYLRTSQYGMDSPRLWESVGARFADDVVPKMLYDELVRELDALAALGPKDLHPGSEGKVHDVIHPSLYPFTADKTPLPNSVQPPTRHGKFVSEMEEKHDYTDHKVILSSAYAWIPTIFTVSEDGQNVFIDGYINGLGRREQYPTLFQLLESTFKVAMPMLEHSAKFVFSHESADERPRDRFEQRKDYNEEEDANLEGYNKILEEQNREKEVYRRHEEIAIEQKRHAMRAEKQAYVAGEHDQVPDVSSIWAGKNLKVIVKAANYVLQPGQDYTGSWHIEGMPHERIVASAIYYYERDSSIVDAGLYLRRKRDDTKDWPGNSSANRSDFNYYFEKKERDDDDKSDNDVKKDESEADEDEEGDNVPSDFGEDVGDMPAYFNIGVLPTTSEDEQQGTGRIITFPNWLQHRVHSVYNHPDAEKAATRKILCFFLVDDSDKNDELDFPGFKYVGLEGNFVLTTSDVPSQERACNLPTLGLLLPIAVRQLTQGRRSLPREIVEIILKEAVKDKRFGLSRAEAEKRRRQLMEDRKVNAREIDGLWQAEYSLCEH